MSAYILPAFIILVIVVGVIKKISIFDCFATGAKEGVHLIVSVFPFLCAIMIAVELFSMSGLSKYFSKILEPVLTFLGVPSELCELLVILPLSGNGSIAMLENIYNTYGVDSFIARCASVIVSASETVFYIATMYFSTTKVKKLRYAIPVALLSTYAGVLISCLMCRLL